MVPFFTISSFASGLGGTYVRSWFYQQGLLYQSKCSDVDAAKVNSASADAFSFVTLDENKTTLRLIATCKNEQGSPSEKTRDILLERDSDGNWSYDSLPNPPEGQSYSWQTLHFYNADVARGYVNIVVDQSFGSQSCTDQGCGGSSGPVTTLYLVKYESMALPRYGFVDCGLTGNLATRITSCAGRIESLVDGWKLVSRNAARVMAATDHPPELWLSPTGNLFYWIQWETNSDPGVTLPSQGEVYRLLNLKELEPLQWTNIFAPLFENNQAILPEFQELRKEAQVDLRTNYFYDTVAGAPGHDRYCVQDPKNQKKSLRVFVDFSQTSGISAIKDNCGGIFDNSGFWFYAKPTQNVNH